MRAVQAVVFLCVILVSPALAVRFVGAAASERSGLMRIVMRLHPVTSSTFVGIIHCRRPSVGRCLFRRGSTSVSLMSGGEFSAQVQATHASCTIGGTFDGVFEGRYDCVTDSGLTDTGNFRVWHP